MKKSMSAITAKIPPANINVIEPLSTKKPITIPNKSPILISNINFNLLCYFVVLKEPKNSMT
jgi:hypothetical protein